MIFMERALYFHTLPFFSARWSGWELVLTRVISLCHELGLPSGSQGMWTNQAPLSHFVSPCNEFSDAFICITHPLLQSRSNISTPILSWLFFRENHYFLCNWQMQIIMGWGGWESALNSILQIQLSSLLQIWSPTH